jgi:hypothetical protein
MKKSAKLSDTAAVDAYMAALDHPFKPEIETLRAFILGISPYLQERIKWNSPSFYYKIDLAAFHLRERKFVHLIMVYPRDTDIQDETGLLEGKHKDRRELKFYSMEDVEAKKPALNKVVEDWLRLVEAMG